MAIIREIIPVKTYIGKLSHNADLLEELESLCIKYDITLGRIVALGAVQKARLAYYNQDKKVYEFFEINKHLEISSLVGNVSLKDGNPVVHAHITLADEKGKAFGGHLAAGTIVFACEVCIEAFQGDELIRGYDETTGLPLWEMNDHPDFAQSLNSLAHLFFEQEKCEQATTRQKFLVYGSSGSLGK